MKSVVAALLLAIWSIAHAQSPALDTWAKIAEVFSHPRCANCHVGEDSRPRWSGPSYGEGWQYHGMNIHGGPTLIGFGTLPCSSCHTGTNADVPHGAPGAPAWALPPPNMAWWQRSSAQICAQIKDPARNGGRTLDAVAEHVAHDELVLWGWAPGPGREPAPYSGAEVAQFIRQWAQAGAPCPPE